MNKQTLSTAPAGILDAASVRKFSKAKPLAARLGLSSKTVMRWADAGKIHRYKVNDRVVLFDEAEVTAFISACVV
jgi:excisionase family DNA binding protein